MNKFTAPNYVEDAEIQELFLPARGFFQQGLSQRAAELDSAQIALLGMGHSHGPANHVAEILLGHRLAGKRPGWDFQVDGGLARNESLGRQQDPASAYIEGGRELAKLFAIRVLPT